MLAIALLVGMSSRPRRRCHQRQEKKRKICVQSFRCGICLKDKQDIIDRGKLPLCGKITKTTCEGNIAAPLSLTTQFPDHFFCFSCILQWARVNASCPECKTAVSTFRKNNLVGTVLCIVRSRVLFSSSNPQKFRLITKVSLVDESVAAEKLFVGKRKLPLEDEEHGEERWSNLGDHVSPTASEDEPDDYDMNDTFMGERQVPCHSLSAC